MRTEMQNVIIVLIGSAVVCWSGPALAQADPASWEDLSGCKLPNGIVVLPTKGSALARKRGSIFSFEANKLSPRPRMKGRKYTAQDLIQAIGAAKAGDIEYFAVERGGFIVISGRIVDLGKRYLYEFDGRKFPRPKAYVGKEDGEAVPGMLAGLQKSNGHCYLIETADHKYVIFRLISQGNRSARIQWVYQPDGSRTFSVPRGAVIVDKSVTAGVRSVDAAQGGLSIATLDMRDFAKATETHLENRTKIVKLTIKLISSRGANLSNRRIAAILLGQLRAVEGAPVLAAHINDNLALRSLEITVQNSNVCVGALIQIGIPGAIAALCQIENDIASEPPKQSDTRLWIDRLELRRNLLSLVVLKVYGEKLAKVVLEDRIKEAKDPKAKEAFKKALESFSRIRNWLPDKKEAGK